MSDLQLSLLVIGLVDNVVRPILVGKDTRMPDYVVLISTLGGIAIFGLDGLVLGPVIAAIFGEGSGLSRLVYALVGLSALYQIVPLLKAFELDQPRAEAARR